MKGGIPATSDPAALDAYPEGLYSYTFYYLQPLGLAAALAGWAVVSRQRFWPSWGFLALAAAFAVAFFYDPHITPDHFWAGRRYVSVILPASLLLIGAAAFTPAPLPEWRGLAWTRGSAAAQLRLAVGMVLIAALGWQYMQATRPILRHVEHAGMIPTVEQLAERFSPEDLLLFGNRGVSDAQAFALPLAYVYAENVLSLREWEPDPKLLRQFPRLGAHPLRTCLLHRQRHSTPLLRDRRRAGEPRTRTDPALRPDAERLSQRVRQLGVRLQHLRPPRRSSPTRPLQPGCRRGRRPAGPGNAPAGAERARASPTAGPRRRRLCGWPGRSRPQAKSRST